MFQKIYIVLLLLVIVMMEFAHANIWKQINNTKIQTSSTNNNKIDEYPVKNEDKIQKIMKYNAKEDNISNVAHSPGIFSVVQDWNLVCKQLCGAGLGGSTCGNPQCEDIKNSQTGNIAVIAKKLLQSKENLICQDLCKYGLGGDICTCQPEIFAIIDTPPSVMWDRNQVCYTFCLHNDITLIGCSLCTKIKPTDSPTPVVTKTTTPNWKEICNDLCKTGDGGALCNCDKPPFF